MRLGLRTQKRVRREFFPDDYKGALGLLTRFGQGRGARGLNQGVYDVRRGT